MATEAPLYRADKPITQDLESSPSRAENEEVSLLDALILVGRNKRLILSVAGIVALAAVLLSIFLPVKYTAVSTILPPQQSSPMAAVLASQLGNMGGMTGLVGSSLGIKNSNDMLVAMLKSRTVEDAMVQRYGLMQEYKSHYLSEARKTLERHADIDGSTKDGLIRISIEDRDPRRAAELTNGYVEEFRRLSEHLAITEASQRRLFFEQQLADAKNNLAHAEESMKITEQKSGVVQLDSQARSLIEAAASLRAQIAAKELQIRSFQTFATDQNPQLLQAQQELDTLRSQLAKLGGSEDSPDASLIMPRGTVPEVQLEYVRKLRDVKYYETIFDILARQFEMAKLDEAKQGALVQVVDSAIPPDRPSSPKRLLIVAIGIAAGFLLGIVYAFIRAGFERMKEDEVTNNKLNDIRRLFLRRPNSRHAESPR